MSTNNTLFTQVRISLYEKDSLRALATVKVMDALYLTGLRIIEGKNGLFVSMPNRKNSGGEYQDIFFPASKAIRDQMQSTILEAYRKEAGLTQQSQAVAA